MTTRSENRFVVMVNPALLCLVMLSAFAVVSSSHLCREHYAHMQTLEQARWYLQEEHGRLLLEHSAWASHHRVQTEATEQLGMTQPAALEIQVVSP